FIVMLVPEIQKSREVRVHLEDHTPAASAVPAIRPAPGDVLFLAESNRSVTPIPGLDFDFNVVYEHRMLILILILLQFIPSSNISKTQNAQREVRVGRLGSNYGLPDYSA